MHFIYPQSILLWSICWTGWGQIWLKERLIVIPWYNHRTRFMRCVLENVDEYDFCAVLQQVKITITLKWQYTPHSHTQSVRDQRLHVTTVAAAFLTPSEYCCWLPLGFNSHILCCISQKISHFLDQPGCGGGGGELESMDERLLLNGLTEWWDSTKDRIIQSSISHQSSYSLLLTSIPSFLPLSISPSPEIIEMFQSLHFP